jgi:two-component system, NtrC family, response regulator AtoC
MLAYLVIREGTKWTDVFRLVPGRTATIGRAATNQIVIKDERCSRYHAEIFLTRGSWTLRDLDSRNGTSVGTQRIRGDYSLSPGDIVRIANCQLAFVHDLSEAFPDGGGGDGSGQEQVIGDETVSARVEMGDSDVLTLSPTTITHRRGQTSFLTPPREDDPSIPKVGRAARKLCRLAFALAQQTDIQQVTNLALNALFDEISVDAGAVLLVPREKANGQTSTGDLEVIASRTDIQPTYHRISGFLASTVMREGEAVLARNVEDDSTLGSRDSKGEIHSTSVICAPIRQDGKLVGLVHVYSTVSDRTPDPDDLEFTLAVADNVGWSLKLVKVQKDLADVAVNLSQSRDEVVQLRKKLGAESEIIGGSDVMLELQEQIERVAPSRSTILIRGESGVGKELVARAMHFKSPKKKGPFVCLNCAALSETLLESELFGHERGAFTGATERKIGKFEAADRGTLMLDEIGEMSQSIQAKFLRVLEGHPFERVGGNQSINVDVRVIAATNRDLEKAAEQGAFRRDLYFRLRVVEIKVPALRKRSDDVIVLAKHFLERFNADMGRKVRGFTPEAIQHLQKHRWPGNVRELKNVIERAVVFCRGDLIGVEDLPTTSLSTTSESDIITAAESAGVELGSLADVEKAHILRTLNETGWNKSKTATVLSIERSTLDRKIRRYHLKPRSPEDDPK